MSTHKLLKVWWTNVVLTALWNVKRAETIEANYLTHPPRYSCGWVNSQPNADIYVLFLMQSIVEDFMAVKSH